MDTVAHRMISYCSPNGQRWTLLRRLSSIELASTKSYCLLLYYSTRTTPRQPPVRVNVSVYACVLIPTRKHYANTRHDSYYRISPYKPSISPNDSPYKPNTLASKTSLARSVHPYVTSYLPRSIYQPQHLYRSTYDISLHQLTRYT